MSAPSMRRIEPMKMPDIEPAPIADDRPVVRLVAPTELLVDETYQRNLSERSVSLIRRIVAQWDWRSFKPPVCVEVDGALHVVDGQHTAIAAASHGGVELIPVIVSPPSTQQQRALAFVRHNRDRLVVTPTQLHVSLVAAGDEDALTIQQVCDRAGVRILKNSPGAGRFRACDTMAVLAIGSLVSRRHAAGARRVLQICAEAKLSPIGAGEIRAVEELVFGDEYRGSCEDADLTTAIRDLDFEWDRGAKRFAAEHDVPIWRGLAVVLFQKCRKVRHGSRRQN